MGGYCFGNAEECWGNATRRWEAVGRGVAAGKGGREGRAKPQPVRVRVGSAMTGTRVTTGPGRSRHSGIRTTTELGTTGEAGHNRVSLKVPNL